MRDVASGDALEHVPALAKLDGVAIAERLLPGNGLGLDLDRTLHRLDEEGATLLDDRGVLIRDLRIAVETDLAGRPPAEHHTLIRQAHRLAALALPGRADQPSHRQ